MGNTVKLVMVLPIALPCFGATWYSAPSATSGDGSQGNPWSLKIALTNASITAGDTLYLRAGSYRGPGFRSNLTGASGNRVTIRSFPNEWAVITDGISGVLLTTINASTNKADFSGADNWQSGDVIVIDGEHLQVATTVGTPTTWTINRGWDGTTAASHSAGASVIYGADFITHTGSYATFRDFQISGTASTNRVVGASNMLGSGLNLVATGNGNKAVDLIINNVGHPAIGFWQQGDEGEVNGCLIWGTGQYDNDGVLPRGSGIYSQNESGMASVKNIISFRNFTYGAKVYGETGPVHDFQFVGNTVFGNGNSNLDQLEGTSGSTATSNVWFNGNIVLGRISMVYVSTGNSQQHAINNTIVGAGFVTGEQINSVYTNNTVFLMKGVNASELTTAESGYSSGLLAKSELNNSWDYNTWFTGNGASTNAFNFLTTDVSTGWVGFTDWKSSSGFDANSSYAVNWPTDYVTVTVQPLDYDTNRWNLAVVNTTTATNTTLNLASSCSFTAGQQYRLRDAQNYFTVIASGVYQGSGTLTLPLYLTNVSTINGTLTHMTNKHTNVDYPGLFNAFVLERLEGAATNGTIIQSALLRGAKL